LPRRFATEDTSGLALSSYLVQRIRKRIDINLAWSISEDSGIGIGFHTVDLDTSLTARVQIGDS